MFFWYASPQCLVCKRKEKPSRSEWKPGGFFYSTEEKMDALIFVAAAPVVTLFAVTLFAFFICEAEINKEDDDD